MINLFINKLIIQNSFFTSPFFSIGKTYYKISIFNHFSSKFFSNFLFTNSKKLTSLISNSHFYYYLSNVSIGISQLSLYFDTTFQYGIHSAITVDDANQILNITRCEFLNYPSGYAVSVPNCNSVFIIKTNFFSCQIGYYVLSDNNPIQYTHINYTSENFNGGTATLCSYCGARTEFHFRNNNNTYNTVTTFSNSFFFVFTTNYKNVGSYCYGFHNKGASLMGFDTGGNVPFTKYFCFYNNTLTSSYFLFWQTISTPYLYNFIFIKNTNIRMDSYAYSGSGKIYLNDCIFDISLNPSYLGNIILLDNCLFNFTNSYLCFNYNINSNYCSTLNIKNFKCFSTFILFFKLLII